MAITFNIGEQRSIVEMYENKPVDNESGGQQDNFVLLLKTRGKLTKINGNKSIEAGSLQFDKGYQLITRFQNAIIFNSDTRVKVDGVDYMITDWYLETEIKHLYVITLNRVDA